MQSCDVDMRDAFFDSVYDIAAKDRNVIVLTADHGAFSLERFKKDFPGQYFNVGIAEQNMVSVASGLALSGKRVFAYSIINFVTLRCLEQISVDLCGMGLPVAIVGVGAGFTYSTDGPTHHGIVDVAAMSSLPNLTIFNCSDVTNSSVFARLAYESSQPTYIRIEKGKFPALYELNRTSFSEGLALIRSGRDLMLVASGYLVHYAVEVAGQLAEAGIDAGVMDVYRIKPLNRERLLDAVGTAKAVVTVEDNIPIGGLGSMVGTALFEAGSTAKFRRIALGDHYCYKYGERDWMYASHALDPASIRRAALELMQQAK